MPIFQFQFYVIPRLRINSQKNIIKKTKVKPQNMLIYAILMDLFFTTFKFRII